MTDKKLILLGGYSSPFKRASKNSRNRHFEYLSKERKQPEFSKIANKLKIVVTSCRYSFFLQAVFFFIKTESSVFVLNVLKLHGS